MSFLHMASRAKLTCLLVASFLWESAALPCALLSRVRIQTLDNMVAVFVYCMDFSCGHTILQFSVKYPKGVETEDKRPRCLCIHIVQAPDNITALYSHHRRRCWIRGQSPGGPPHRAR